MLNLLHMCALKVTPCWNSQTKSFIKIISIRNNNRKVQNDINLVEQPIRPSPATKKWWHIVKHHHKKQKANRCLRTNIQISKGISVKLLRIDILQNDTRMTHELKKLNKFNRENMTLCKNNFGMWSKSDMAGLCQDYACPFVLVAANLLAFLCKKSGLVSLPYNEIRGSVIALIFAVNRRMAHPS